MILKSPSNIEILLHCHTSPIPHPRVSAPAVREGLLELQKAGVIEPEGDSNHYVYRTTSLGAAWVKLLCTTPIPKVAYVDEQDRVIKGDW